MPAAATRPAPKGAVACPSCNDIDGVSGVPIRKGQPDLYHECRECGSLWHNHPRGSRLARLAERYIRERRQ